MKAADRDELLDRMIRNTRRVIRKIEQLVRDQEWWNKHRGDAPPFDVGRDKATLHFLRKHLKELLKRPKRIDGLFLQRVIQNLQDRE